MNSCNTGSNSWGETDLTALKRRQSEFDAQVDIKGPVSVAVVSSREIPANETNNN